MLSSEIKETFLSFVRLGIGHDVYFFSQYVDWKAIEALAAEHGLSAVVLDGIEHMPEKKRPPQVFLLNWIGDVLQTYEYRHDAYKKAISEMAAFYNRHGFKMMVLKGYACCLDWPRPEHRPCGDVDIWLFGRQKEADMVLTEEKGVIIDNGHPHHTVFTWNGFSFENYYDFLNVHHHKSNVKLEKVLKELAQDSSYFVELFGEKVYLPSANLHALFLLRHAMGDFASTHLTIRQLLDWSFFVDKHTKEIDWEWLTNILDNFGMLKMFNIFNAICVEDLGFAVNIFPKVQFDRMVKARVINDILAPEFNKKETGGALNRTLYKFRRWRANSWKHDLCYNDSLWSAFWSGVKSHLLKPSSI